MDWEGTSVCTYNKDGNLEKRGALSYAEDPNGW